MGRSRVVFVWALLVPAGAAAAGELELGVFAGRAFPTYEQTLNYNPGSFSPPIPLPGISIAQQGTFGLSAKGGLAIGASLAFFPADVFGLEARVDTVGVRGDATGRYTATVTSAFLPSSFTASLDLPPGQVDVNRLTPVSLGLKLRTPGRVRLLVSIGGSYLPKLEATVTEPLAIQLSRFSLPIDVNKVSVVARAQPGEGGGRWGVTAGAGLQIALGRKASFQAEARVFRFRKHTLVWELGGDSTPQTSLEEELLKSGLAALDPVEFNPTLFQATVGFALHF
jgi:Outer membrane protein beta-barrel domain